MKPCPAHRCRDIDGNPNLIPDLKPLCDFHHAKLTQAIGELKGLYAGLGYTDSADLAIPGSDDIQVSISRTAPIPLDINARSLQEDILAVVRAAERMHLHATGKPRPPRRRGRERYAVAYGIRYLAANLDAILTLDARVGLEVLRIKHAARQHLGLTRLSHKLPAPCPECDCLALCRDNGASWVRCRQCGLSFNEDAYGVLVRVLRDANPTAPKVARPPKAQRDRCVAVGPRTKLVCRIEADHKCSHLARSDNSTEWETW